MGADVISISWFYSCYPDQTGSDSLKIKEILDNGTIICAAAGNGLDGNSCPHYGPGPPPYNAPFPFSPYYDERIISVTSTDNSDNHTFWVGGTEVTHSHFAEIDICAPGYEVMGAIPTTDGNGNPVEWPYYAFFRGTSFATPITAGVCALMKSVNSSLLPWQLQDIIKATADPVNDAHLYPNMVGAGRINAFESVKVANCDFSSFPSPEVDGPALVCASNSTFTLHNRHPGATVNWTKSSNLSYVSGQSTDNYKVKAHPYGSSGGPGWVQANISVGNCDAVTIRKDIDVVGTPYVDPLTIQFTCAEGEGYFCTNALGNEYSFTYSYDYNYFDIKLTNLSETQTLWQDQIESTWGTVEYYPPEGTYKFMVRGNNDCGTASSWSKTTVDYVDCGWWGFLNIVPNPATDEITIELKTDDLDTFSEGDTWEAEIFTQQMLLMYKSTQLKDKTYTINVSGWNEGVYFVRAKVNDKVVSGKFIISR